MSRIGRLPIDIPSGVTVTINNNNVTVKGPKGSLSNSFSDIIGIKTENNQVLVTRTSDEKEQRAYHGLTRALIANMVKGVTEGFERRLEINGVGYKAQKQGNKLVLSLGYSHPVEVVDPEGIELLAPEQNVILVKGIDKQQVGQVAAQLRELRPPEPYKGKGIKYAEETIRRKEGKTGKK